MVRYAALFSLTAIGLATAAAAAPTKASLIQGSIADVDYPATALVSRQHGTVLARFLITREGNVTRCEISASSGSPALDNRTCELLSYRFRYNPARDEAGKPIEEWRSQKVSWALPSEAAMKAGYANAAKKAEMMLDIGRDGTVEGCQVERSSGDAAWDNRMCILLVANTKLEPLLDSNGRRQRFTRRIPVWE